MCGRRNVLDVRTGDENLRLSGAHDQATAPVFRGFQLCQSSLQFCLQGGRHHVGARIRVVQNEVPNAVVGRFQTSQLEVKRGRNRGSIQLHQWLHMRLD